MIIFYFCHVIFSLGGGRSSIIVVWWIWWKLKNGIFDQTVDDACVHKLVELLVLVLTTDVTNLNPNSMRKLTINPPIEMHIISFLDLPPNRVTGKHQTAHHGGQRHFVVGEQPLQSWSKRGHSEQVWQEVVASSKINPGDLGFDISLFGVTEEPVYRMPCAILPSWCIGTGYKFLWWITTRISKLISACCLG